MRPIKVNTIKNYIKVAADYALPLGLPDPRLDQHGRPNRYLSSVYDAFKRYESIPNCRDPVSVSMLEYMVGARGG